MGSYSRSPSGTVPFVLNPAEHSFYAAPVYQGLPTLDQDENIIQYIQNTIQGTFAQMMFSFGWLGVSDNPTDDYSSFGLNVFDFKTSNINLGGFQISYNQTDSTTANHIVLPSTASPVHTTDLVFIEVWGEEVTSDGIFYRYGNTQHYDPTYFDNDIIDPAVNVACQSRIVNRYRTRIVSGALAMDSANVFIQGKKVLQTQFGNSHIV